MAFKFRFERLVQQRQRLIDEQGRAVAQASQNVGQAQKVLIKIDQYIVLHQHQHLSRDGASVDVASLASRTRWIAHLTLKRETANEELDLAREELGRSQELLQEAWRNKEILEKLRETQHEKWQLEQTRRERQELDEIGQIRADRQQRARREKNVAGNAGQGKFLPAARTLGDRNKIPASG